MRFSFLFILLAIFLPLRALFAALPAEPYSSAPCSLTSLIKIGARGAEVECLQNKIGIYADGKFGPLTKTAVIAFQLSKGLVPDGVVGTLTRSALTKGEGIASPLPRNCVAGMNYDPITGKPCSAAIVTGVSEKATASLPPKEVPDEEKVEAKVPANLTNLDKFIATVVAVQKRKGVSEKEAENIAETLREEILASSIDYNNEFKNMLEREAKLSSDTSPSFLSKIFTEAFSFLGISPPVAQAASGVQFGGTLIFPFYCAASSNWIITLTPLPPSYVVLLSYTPFTQGFAGYNIPYTRFLLGSYVTGGICSYGYVNIPTEGTITSQTGSSPL